MGYKINAQVTLETTTCAACGTVFAIEMLLMNSLRNSHKDFFCPNGHTLFYNGVSQEEELKKQLKTKDTELLRTKRRLEWEESSANEAREARRQTERRLSATKGVLTRTKNRIANGICPCYNRYFEQLHKHMLSQHPGYEAQQPENVGTEIPAPVFDEAGAPPKPTGGDMDSLAGESEEVTPVPGPRATTKGLGGE